VLEVLRVEKVTPGMNRVVAGGPGLVDYQHIEFTDAYVKLAFAPRGVTYAEPTDIAAIRRDHPESEWPRLRTFTVRAFDAAAGDLTIDFVDHGDDGLAGPWAARAQAGDRMYVLGPGGAYAPDPTLDWHLFVGDEAALPAIAAALAAVPHHAGIRAVIEVPNQAEQAYLGFPARAEVIWLVRDRGDRGLAETVAAMPFPHGTYQAFVHGELATMRQLRTHLLQEREIPVERLSLSGYWRRGKDEDGFQAEKRAEAEANGWVPPRERAARR
jgi:NADPH-dependent ferric siderophore reductase